MVDSKNEQAVSNGESPFDSLALDYDAWFEGEGKLHFSIEVKAFQKLLPALPKPWLEIGVGSGRFAQALGIDTGIDPSKELVEIARSRGINAIVARGEEQIFREKSFGTVFIVVTLCFVDSALSVLHEAHRLLKAEGKAVIGLVLRDSPWGRRYSMKKEQGHRFYKHANFYSYWEVLELLKQSGFAVERIISTLFQEPERVEVIELPQEGFFSEAGFTIIVADKVAVGIH